MTSYSINYTVSIDQTFIETDRKKKFATLDTVITDSIIDKEPTLLDKVQYKAADYVRINRKESKLILYNEAEV